ncbi:WXG100 family type VII secretion target [Bacillus mangrovi]|uniref:ESAT-6-like protein n=1 Tax=Metabacillus mangrovi TaxID=1491830 RepID=A0A7X2S5U4_9BACI|nr:WXG100 family type VII secretion target [Metabacillus mangrovi]MTH53962.1 WXG100 family type VII secretion target [Metabacillus mangrovi]
MSQLIKVTPEELYTKANDYKAESENVHQQIGRLNTKMQELQELWKGSASDAFATQWEELRPSVQKMEVMLAEVSEQLTKTGQALQQADQDIAGQIRG